MLWKLVYSRRGSELEVEIVDCVTIHGARKNAEMTLSGLSVAPRIHERDGWVLAQILGASKAEMRAYRKRVKEAEK